VGVLDGLEVLDLSWGMSGPMTGMLLADHGARVTKIEPPGGDPWRHLSGYRVWNRGKRSAVLDLKSQVGRDRFKALAASADVLIESFKPGTSERLGIDYSTMSACNPRLVYCSITAYGPDGSDSERPGIDALVAARTGQQWEVRGIKGGTIGRLSGTAGMMPDLEAPAGCWVGPDRPGPLFSGVPWVSLATFYIASVGINAAIRAREITGRGQHVNASMLQGVLATTVAAWQQVERPDAPFFETWVLDPRAPKGFFQAADGRWLHHWVPLPEFILGAAANGMKASDDVPGPKTASLRVSTAPEDMVVLHTYQDQLCEAVAAYPSADWVRLAAEVGVPVQTVRSPEEALLDPELLSDGCVIEVDDPEVGRIRQVGRVVELARHRPDHPSPAPSVGQDTAEVMAETDALLDGLRLTADQRASTSDTAIALASPLDGVLVLDLGLAVAGPFGTQVLAQLGARVIKVNTFTDKFWFSNHIAMCCNRDKESITLNLKDPEAMSVLYRLVERADVVQHNMRYDAAERLGIDYDSLRQLNPRLVYCHTLGHEQGPRGQDPGNDQTAAALAGTEWLDGGLDHGGRPVWSCTSLGDTGNGFLSALGIIQALYDRDRTGFGQLVRTSILYAHLLNASTAWVTPDGAVTGERQVPDAQQYGWGALYRLYETAEGWLCVAALDEAAWVGLCGAAGREDLRTDERFASPASRRTHDFELASELADVFRGRSAAAWYHELDDRGVPCEISDPDYVVRLFADATAERQRLVSTLSHRVVGRMKMAGLYFDLSDTPGRIWGPPLWPGQDTRRILDEIGYSHHEVEKLIASGAVEDTGAR
jgi:crotonobetainyl-CoA:carnitine CoA-transferase CaiB-like acyl-CoA transferase